MEKVQTSDYYSATRSLGRKTRGHQLSTGSTRDPDLSQHPAFRHLMPPPQLPGIDQRLIFGIGNVDLTKFLQCFYVSYPHLSLLNKPWFYSLNIQSLRLVAISILIIFETINWLKPLLSGSAVFKPRSRYDESPINNNYTRIYSGGSGGPKVYHENEIANDDLSEIYRDAVSSDSDYDTIYSNKEDNSTLLPIGKVKLKYHKEGVSSLNYSELLYH